MELTELLIEIDEMMKVCEEERDHGKLRVFVNCRREIINTQLENSQLKGGLYSISGKLRNFNEQSLEGLKDIANKCSNICYDLLQ